MKCNKTLIAVAIAGIAAAPMMASADTTLFGVVDIQLQGTDQDDVDAAPAVVANPAAGIEASDEVFASEPGDIRIAADDVLFGLTSEHKTNLGVTGYASLRVDMNRLSNEGTQTFDPFNTPGNDDDDLVVTSLGSADSIFVGLKGGFGNIRFGETFNPVEAGQVANDIFDVAGDINGGIGYKGGFGPVTVQAAWSPEQNEDVTALGGSFNFAGFGIGAGFEERADVDAFSVGASFSFAGAAIAANFFTVDEDGGTDGDLESVTVKVGYSIFGASADLTFAHREDDGDIDDDSVRLDLSYSLGGGTSISSRITADDPNVGEDILSYRLKLSKSF